MADELKSAYELAMERMRAKGVLGEERTLSDEQKERIAEVREELARRRAEAKVTHQQGFAKLRASGDAEKLAAFVADHERELAELDAEEKRRVEEIRGA